MFVTLDRPDTYASAAYHDCMDEEAQAKRDFCDAWMDLQDEEDWVSS